MSTFVLAGRGSDGVVMVADRRFVDGNRMELISDTQRKVHVVGGKVVLNIDGVVVMWKDIVDGLEAAFESGAIGDFNDAVATVRESFVNVWDRYAPAYPEQMQIGGFLAGLSELTSGHAQLAVVGARGLIDEIPDFQCGGSAGLKSQNLVRLLWDTEMLVDDLWKLAVFCCCYTATFDLTVGGVPTVHLVKDGRGIEEVESEGVAQAMAATEAVAARLPGQLLAMLSRSDWQSAAHAVRRFA